jgi:hypothetical protein
MAAYRALRYIATFALVVPVANWYDEIDAERRAFIERQHLFFVATAPSNADDEFANVSPKGRTLVRVLGPNLVGWLDYPGSGNETAKHTAENGRITVMFCSFDTAPGIVRLYGRGRAVDLDACELKEHQAAFASDMHPYVRQAFFVEVERVQTSCGYAVPRYTYLEDRDTLDRWCERKMEPRAVVDGAFAPGELVRRA